jgi:ATP-binding cassette subfamily B protein
VFDHLLDLPPTFFESTRTGEVISRLINDTTMLETVVGSSASMAIRNFLLMVGGLVMLTLTSAKLTLLVLAGVPLVVAPIVLFGRRVRKLRARRRIASATSVRFSTSRCTRSAPSRVTDTRRATAPTLRRASKRRSPPATRRVRQRALLVAAVIVLVFGAIGVILWIGGHDVVAGRLERRPAFGIRVLCGAGRRRSRLDQRGYRRPATRRRCDRAAVRAPRRAAGDPGAGESGADARAGSGHRHVRRRDVPLPVTPDTPALEHFSLDIRASEKVALVGPSGAGKTTVFQLLLRFYDPQAGVVRIDGVELRAAEPRDVRRQLALVPQDPVILRRPCWRTFATGVPMQPTPK